MTAILGISAYYHDSAACLVVDGDIVAATQEERFTRKRHDAAFPHRSVAYCLEAGGLRPDQIDHVVFYDKPFLKFDRIFETYLAFAPKGFRSFARSLPVWLKEKLFQRAVIMRALEPTFGDLGDRLLFSEHHLSHAASAFFPSPFQDAAVLTMDGVGEWVTTSVCVGRGNDLEIAKEIHFPHSLGLLYSAFTYYTGFKVNSGEYKVMGLAPYGEPKYADLIREHLIDVRPDGSFALDMQYFNYCTGLTMTNDRFAEVFGGPARPFESQLTQREMDLAASVQVVVEDVVVRLARSTRAETGMRHLCLAGGVALNCVANGVLLRERIFDDIWVQPAAGDSGGAVGAALAAYHLGLGRERRPQPGDAMHGSYLGTSYGADDVERRMRAAGAVYTRLGEDELVRRTAAALADGKSVGWHQGRMEFGPRALGARSILADPRSPDVQRRLNLQVKKRESFRPFAPSVLREDVAEWFELDGDSPYMLIVADVAASKRTLVPSDAREVQGLDRLKVLRSVIPAVTHVDDSARIHTVRREVNPRYHALLGEFKRLTGCPVLVNTSFNVRGEPIVESPEDALRCFMRTDIEVLVVGDCYLEKADQPSHLVDDTKFELD
ncbi:MAG: carbamoyltransferase [Acidimicrobiia bacterium]